MTERGMKLTAASCAHFLVDFACAFALFRQFSDAGRGAGVLLAYNFCAFALQMPLGLLADRWNRNLLLSALGCLVTALGLLPLPGAACVLALGAGNAAFHVGGGLEILTEHPDRCGALGVFVSPGALGLYFGTVLGRGALVPRSLPVFLLCAAAASLLGTQRAFRPDFRSENVPAALPGSSAVLWPLAALFAVVALRSVVGMGLTLDWKIGGWGFAAVCALAAGKAAGGYLADRFGLRRTAAVSLLGALTLFFFAAVPACGLAAVFLFNMTMPLTLHGAARLLPGAKGFAFGLLTFALFLGFLPVYFGARFPTGAAAAGLTLATACLLLPALGKVERT